MQYKVDGVAAFFRFVLKPFVSADGHAVVPLPAPLMAGACEFLALSLQKIRQIDRVGALFLFFCKHDVFHVGTPPREHGRKKAAHLMRTASLCESYFLICYSTFALRLSKVSTKC